MSMAASIEVATMITIGQSDIRARQLKRQQQQPIFNSHAPEPKAKSQEIVIETQAQGLHAHAQAHLLLSKSQPSLPAKAPVPVDTSSFSSQTTSTASSISPISSNTDIYSILNTTDPKEQLPSIRLRANLNQRIPSISTSARRPQSDDFSARRQQHQPNQQRSSTPSSRQRRRQPSSSRPHTYHSSTKTSFNPSTGGGFTSMDDGYSSQGGYSTHAGLWSSPDEFKYSSGNGSSGRRRATPTSSSRQKSRYYGDRKHARQYLKNMQRIHTTYTPFWLAGHIGLILYRIIMLLCTPSPFQLVSFTHLVYLTDTAFHIVSLAWHLLRFPKLERITVIYGTWIVWIGWGLAIWLSDPDMEIHQQEYRAAFGIGYDVNGKGSHGMGGGDHPWGRLHTYGSNDSIDINKLLPLAPFVKKYSNWYILYMPVATFLGLLMFRRNLWGLISWEHLTRMDQIGQLKYYRAWCLFGVGVGWSAAWKFCRWWFHVPFMPMDDPIFCQYASSGKSCLDLLEAAAAAQRSSYTGQYAQIAPTVVRYRTDVIEFRIWPMILSNLVMGLILMCWWSFWTFQYQGVVWREDLKEGWAVWRTTTGGVMTGLVTDEELRKSVKDWTGTRNSSNGGASEHHREHNHYQRNSHPPYSGSTTPKYS